MTTADYLNQLEQDREDFVDNLETKGISGLSGDETFTELVPQVLNISGGGGQTNIYRVPTIAQRNLINANEDDMCVVENNSIGNWQQNTNASNITFPQQVILSSAYMDWFDGMLRADQSSGVYFDGQISLYEQEFRLQGWGDTIQVNVQYNSNDGITYTRQRIEAEDMSTQTSLVDGDTINLPFNVYIDGNWTNEIGYFMQTGVETFDGLFIYKNNAWQYAYVGANTEAMDLFTGKLAYTNNGFVSGTLGTTINKDILRANYKEICDCINNFQPTSLSGAFSELNDTKLPITKIIDTSHTTDMYYVFQGCRNLTSLDLSNWDTSNVETMSYMFSSCGTLTDVDVSNFNTSKVENMQNMFNGCNNLTNVDVSNFDTSKVENFSSMFNGCRNHLTQLDVSNWNISSAKTLSAMFNNCASLTSLNLSNWLGTTNLTDVSGMFANCSGLTSLDLSDWNGTNITTMSNMFVGCSGLTSLDLTNFTTSSNLANMNQMFANCSNLTILDLSSFITSSVYNVGSMFYGCTSLTRLDIRNCDFTQITSSAFYSNMFGSASYKVPANCLIIVKNNAMKSWITSKFNWLTNVKTPSEL